MPVALNEISRERIKGTILRSTMRSPKSCSIVSKPRVVLVPVLLCCVVIVVFVVVVDRLFVRL